MKVMAHFHFRLAGLDVSADLLGSTHTLRYHDYRINFTLPATPDDFGLNRGESHDSALGGGVKKDDRWVCSSVNLMRVSVEFEIPDTVPLDSPDIVAVEEVTALLSSAANAARQVVHDYTNLIRTWKGQHWLGHSAQSPRVTWVTKLVNLETGQRLPIGYGDPITAVCPSVEYALSMDNHIKALEAVESGLKAGVPELLMADAKYLAWSSELPQYREAILMAAVAAEVKIKECLDSACSDAARPLLDYVLRNPRDVSVQAVSLYDKVAEVVAGRSFREETPEVYRALGRLFENRNAVAHRAQNVEREDVRSGLSAAEKALGWADGLVAKR